MALNKITTKPSKHKFFYVVFNINGDVIGIADSFGKGLSIYEQRYNNTPSDSRNNIIPFEINKFYYK
jgi:hypothetical protein